MFTYDKRRSPVQSAHDHDASRPFITRQRRPGVSQADLKWLGITGDGKSLPHGERVQRAFGRFSLEGIRAHVGTSAVDAAAEELDAQALASGEHVAFRTEPDAASVAHEVTHVLQQRSGVSPLQARERRGAYEDVANAVARRVAAGICAEDILEACVPQGEGAQSRVVQLQTASTAAPTVSDAMAGSSPWTRQLAERALGQYGRLTNAQRDAWLQRHQTVEAMLHTLAPADVTGSGKFVGIVRDILERTQRTSARHFALGIGLKSEQAMTSAQATFMHQRNVAAAQALSGGTAPSAAAVSAQQANQVAATSISPQSVPMTPQKAAQLNAQIQALIPALVQYAAQHHPVLKLKANQIRADAKAINDRGAGIIAFASGSQAVVGEPFLQAAQANLAYVMPTIVHELYGHPDYGPYGTEYNLVVYDKAAAKMPGYARPAGAGRTSELDAYAYQETEIYSLLREVDYYVPVTPAHQALASVNYAPGPTIEYRMGLIKDQFEYRVAYSLVHGLARRIHADPRLSKKAKGVFDAAVWKVYPSEAPLLLL